MNTTSSSMHTSNIDGNIDGAHVGRRSNTGVGRFSRFGRLALVSAAAAGFAVIGFAGAASANTKDVTPKANCTNGGGSWHTGVGQMQGWCKLKSGDVIVWRDDHAAYYCYALTKGGYLCI